MNFKEMKKIKDDEHSATFQHPHGHTIVIAKAPLSKKLRKEMEELPIHRADGGDTGEDSEDEDSETPDASQGEDKGVNVNINTPPAIPSDLQSGVPIVPGAQPSAAPKAPPIPLAAVQPNAPKGSVPNITVGDVYKTSTGAIEAQKQAETFKAQKEAAVAQQQEDRLKASQAQYEAGVAAKNNEINNIIHDKENNHIDPLHYQESQSTGQKIRTTIGLILGGMGSGTVGGSNPALDFLNAQIDRDINAQKANMENKNTILGAYFKQIGNMQAAQDMARATNMALYSADLQKAAAQSGSKFAQANAFKATAALQQQMLPLVMRAQALQMATPVNGQTSEVDPSILVTRMIPKERQKEVLDAIGDAKSLISVKNRVTELYNIAANDPLVSSGFGRGAAALKEMDLLLEPAAKHQLGGRASPEQIQHMLNQYHPASTDRDYTKAANLRGIHGLLHFGYDKLNSITTAHGLNLKNFASTSMEDTANLSPQQKSLYEKAMQRLKINPSDPFGIETLKKLGLNYTK